MMHRGTLVSNLALISLCLLIGAVHVQAQTFQPVPSLYFTMPYGGANPLPQLVTISSTGASFPYYQTATTNSGGSWLSVPACNNSGYPCYTPYPVAVGVSGSSLAAGTYTGKIVFTDTSNTKVTLTVSVTLTIVQSTAAFFDNLPGGLTFFLKTGGTATSQQIQIRNAGAGSLNWNLTATTGIGGAWLTASSSSGTATSNISIGINTANLPSGAGTYVGQLLLSTSGDSTTIPVAVTVGTAIFEQVNPISFTIPVGGASPLPQILTIESTNNSSIPYFQAATTANGGNWLSVPGCNNAGYPCYTPFSFAVIVQNGSSLAAGTYMGQVTVYQDTNSQMAINVPVTLNVVSSGAFFNYMAGGLSFYMTTSGSTVPQTIPVGNGGTGTLNWTVTASTSDGGAWLAPSPASGTAPSDVTAGVTPADLPGGGAVAGTFVGQLLFQSGNDSTTVPVAVTVGTADFEQVNPISFTMPVGGADPLAQILTVESANNSGIPYYQVAYTSNGGNWLSAPTCNNSGYPCYTPFSFAVNVQNATSLPAGTYAGEVVVDQDTNPSMSIVVPVTLNVVPSGAFFNSLPGALSFYLKEDGTTVPQTISVGNAGTGTLDWTVTAASTGGWLSATPTSGAAPSNVSVSVNAANLPNGSGIAGTYLGQLLFQTGTDTTTVPVAVTVGTSIFEQVNPISVTMPVGGANPEPQIVTIESTDNSAIPYYQVATTSTGGSWLSVPTCNNSGYPCYTPYPFAVNFQNTSALAAGTYTGQVTIYQDTNSSMSLSVPVTLNVVPSGGLFANLPGALNFTLAKGSTTTSPQKIQVENGGTGTLTWTVAPSTSDGGAWLSATPTSGTAPTEVSVSLTAANLPNGGAVAGTYIGQLLFQDGTQTATVPVVVTVESNVFTQVNPISFTMPVGGANPLPQILTIGSTTYNTSLSFYQVATTSNGGNWLSVTACDNNGYPCYTPYPVTVNVQNATSLSAGTYTGEITVYEDTNSRMSLNVPVTLHVVPSGASFGNLPGQMSFSIQQNAKTITSQALEITNAGTGSLKFTITPSTSDGGAWLKASVASSTAPKTVSVEITPANLPGAGELDGTFVGQLLLISGSDTATIPITVTVGAAVFTQMNPLNFVMPVGGANPLPQILTVASINASAIPYYQVANTATGGNWLSVPACNNGGYPCYTPDQMAINIQNTSELAAGVYTGQVTIYQDTNSALSMTVPVTLTVVGSGKALFDNLPGETTFSLLPGATSRPAQNIQLGNGGTGTLAWTASTNTADTGKWLKVTPAKGTGAGSYSVSVVVADLPDKGKIAGTFLGRVILATATGDVTIPVVVTVASPAFVQANPVGFTATQGTNPDPQTVTIESNGNALDFYQVSYTGKGGDWLSVPACNNSGYPCATPSAITLNVTSSSLAPGTYYADVVVFEDTNGSQSMTFQVVLTVSP